VVRFEKYRKTRFWAVYVDHELVAVVVYRKGAQEIARRLLATVQPEEVAA
jgi:hypothetical protein